MRDQDTWLYRSDDHVARTMFYAVLAKTCGIPYAPHPARCSLFRLLTEKQLNVAADTVLRFSEWAKNEATDLKRSFSGYHLSVEVPPVAQYVINLTEQRRDLVDKIADVRNSRHAKEFRKWCFALQKALAQGLSGLADAKKLKAELDRALALWSRDVDDHVKYVKRRITITSVAMLLGIEAEFERKDPILFGGDLKHIAYF